MAENINLCNERHENIERRFISNEKTLEKHSDYISETREDIATLTANTTNLVTSMDSMMSITKWVIGLFVGGCVSFFFYAIQQGVF